MLLESSCKTLKFKKLLVICLFVNVFLIQLKCDSDTPELSNVSSVQHDLDNEQKAESETNIDESCRDFTNRSNAVKKIDNTFRLFSNVVHNSTLLITWERPNFVQNESICGYVLLWSDSEHKTNSKKHVAHKKEPQETSHSLQLNNNVSYWFHVNLYYQGGSKVLASTELTVKRGWGKGKNIVGKFYEADHPTTPDAISYFFRKEAMHPLSAITIVILFITVATLLAVVVMAIFRCVSNRAGVPYIFNRPVLNTRESLGRARNKVRKVRNIFKDGSRGDAINFSTLVDQTEFEC